MIKKLMALFTAVVICGASLTGCAEKDGGNSGDSSAAADSASSSAAEGDSSAADSTADSGASDSQAQTQTLPEASLTIDGNKVDTNGLVMLTVDGRDVDFDTFRYYYFGTINQLTQQYGATLETIKNTENGFESLMDNVIRNIKQDYVTFRLAEENGIELTDEDKAANEESYQNLIKQAGTEEDFKNILKKAYLTEDVTKNMVAHAKLFEKTNVLFTEDGKYGVSKEEFKKIVQDPDVYACVRSILIPYECKAELNIESDIKDYDTFTLSEKMEAKKRAYSALSDRQKEEVKAQSLALAQDVAKRANNGEDFEALLKEYGWDPGMESNPQGYYVTHETSFVPEYLEAVYKLKEGEVVSEPVLSESYGWFIIKRNPIDMEYVEQNLDSMFSEYISPIYQKVYTDIMDSMNVTFSDTYNKLTIDSIT